MQSVDAFRVQSLGLGLEPHCLGFIIGIYCLAFKRPCNDFSPCYGAIEIVVFNIIIIIVIIIIF